MKVIFIFIPPNKNAFFNKINPSKTGVFMSYFGF